MLEKCSESQFNTKDAAPTIEHGSAALTCAISHYRKVHPDRIQEDGSCAAPGEVDQKALNDVSSLRSISCRGILDSCGGLLGNVPQCFNIGCAGRVLSHNPSDRRISD